MADNRIIQFASSEKALLDLLYLYPFYDNEQELEELRLDEDYLHDDLNSEKGCSRQSTGSSKIQGNPPRFHF